MTLNFGHKVTIGFLAFVALIVTLVVGSMRTHYDLVSKDYYKDELQYQQVIDGTSRANQLNSKTTIQQSASQLVLQLPAEMKAQPIKGSVLFYSADNAQKDKRYELQMNAEGTQFIDSRAFMAGNYTAKVRWESNEQVYFAEVPVTIQ